jgi:hypothetical protein
MSSMSMTSIWVFADFAAAKWGLAVLKGAESFILFVASHVDFLWILHSWSFMNPFWLYDFYVIFLHRGQLWKTHFFFCRCGGARTPEVRSPDRAARGATLSYSKSCLGMVFKPCLFCISTWTCLAMHLWAESWAPIFNILYIFQTYSNTCELGCPKKTRGPTCPHYHPWFLVKSTQWSQMPFLRSKVFRWTRRRRSWIERSQNSFVAICVAKLQTALEMPYQKISDRFVAVGIPWCNATASFRVVKVDSSDLRPTTLWMRVFLCGESLVYSRDS